MKKKIINYLAKDFMKSLVINGSIFDNTPKIRARASYLWAVRRYLELSEEEKQEILKKIK
jgi:hypothetical protein